MTSTLVPTPVLQSLELAAALHGKAGDRLYRAIAADYPASLERRPAQLLTAARATASDLDQLLQAAGFTDTMELRQRAGKEINRKVVAPDLSFTSRQGDPGDRSSLRRVLLQEQTNLSETLEALETNGALELAARAILGSRQRWVFGDMKSIGYASLFAADLTLALRDVRLVPGSPSAVVTALTDAHPADTLTVFSFRHYSRLTLRMAEQFKDHGGTVIALTDNYDSPVSECADHVLAINTASESATHSPTAVVAVGHILASLAAAGAKGATRRARMRSDFTAALNTYSENDPDADEGPEA